MSETEKNFSEFVRVDEGREILKYLSDATKFATPTTVWIKDQGNPVESRLFLSGQRNPAIFIHISSTEAGTKFASEVLRATEKECLFNIPLPHANLFFKTQFIEYNPGKLRFSIPLAVYKVQRRGNVRFKIPFGRTLKVEIQLQEDESPLSRRVFDLSASGLSFLTFMHDIERFSPGTELQSITLTIRLQKITLCAVVAHTKFLFDNPEDTGLRVGVAFKNQDAPTTRLITSYALEESSKALARFT